MCGGAARVRWAEATDWSALQVGAPVIFRKPAEVMALTEGARLCLGDGSTLELSPGARILAQEPGSFPLLDVSVLDGEVTLIAQKASYRIGTSAVSMTLLKVPTRARIQLNGGTLYVRIEEGAVNCATGDEAITLPTCWEMRKPEGEAAQVNIFCATPILTPSPMATSPGPALTQT
ncbi:MAG: FecR domain-containing protein, partial [Anaerolineae bacterium]|nr:FecR domain-containing protein [Anaerolineae bacterium]